MLQRKTYLVWGLARNLSSDQQRGTIIGWKSSNSRGLFNDCTLPFQFLFIHVGHHRPNAIWEKKPTPLKRVWVGNHPCRSTNSLKSACQPCNMVKVTMTQDYCFDVETNSKYVCVRKHTHFADTSVKQKSPSTLATLNFYEG